MFWENLAADIYCFNQKQISNLTHCSVIVLCPNLRCSEIDSYLLINWDTLPWGKDIICLNEYNLLKCQLSNWCWSQAFVNTHTDAMKGAGIIWIWYPTFELHLSPDGIEHILFNEYLSCKYVFLKDLWSCLFSWHQG